MYIYICHKLFICSSVDAHLGYLYISAIKKCCTEQQYSYLFEIHISISWNIHYCSLKGKLKWHMEFLSMLMQQRLWANRKDT